MPASPCASRRPLRSRGARVIAGIVAAVALLLGPGAGAAAAHDTLVGSAPAAGATLRTAPASVTLEFSDAPQALGTQVGVTGPDGASVSQEDPDARGSSVVQPLADELSAGTYTVDWRVVSADGHPLSGSFDFTVAEGTASGPDEGSDPGSTAGAARPGDGSSFPVLGVAVGGIVALAVGLSIRQLRRPA